MENAVTEALGLLLVSLGTGLVAWWRGRVGLRQKAEAITLDYQAQIIASNKLFQAEIAVIRQERTDDKIAFDREKETLAAINRNLSAELQAQLISQATERDEWHREIADYQQVVKRQDEKLENAQTQITELSTQVTGFKTLADQVVVDRNQIKQELEKTAAQLAESLKTIGERDVTILALKTEKETSIQELQGRITNLENDLKVRDAQIKELTEKVQGLELQQQREEPSLAVPTETGESQSETPEVA